MYTLLVIRGYGATAARLTPDQKVGSSNLSALTFASGVALRMLAAQGGAVTTYDGMQFLIATNMQRAMAFLYRP